MREYTVVKTLNSGVEIAEILALKFLVMLKVEESSNPLIITGRPLKANNDQIICETQGFYEGIPFSQANQGTKVDLYKDWRKNEKLGEGLIMSKYFEKATRLDWKIEQALDETNSLAQPFYMEFSQEEKELLEYGDVPKQMEDKWFSYVESNVIHYLRSWTGIEIFKASLEKTENDLWCIREVQVSNNPESSGVNRSSLFKDLIKARINRMQLVCTRAALEE